MCTTKELSSSYLQKSMKTLNLTTLVLELNTSPLLHRNINTTKTDLP